MGRKIWIVLAIVVFSSIGCCAIKKDCFGNVHTTETSLKHLDRRLALIDRDCKERDSEDQRNDCIFRGVAGLLAHVDQKNKQGGVSDLVKVDDLLELTREKPEYNLSYCNKAKFDEYYAMKKKLSEISVLKRFCEVGIAKLKRVCHDRESDLFDVMIERKPFYRELRGLSVDIDCYLRSELRWFDERAYDGADFIKYLGDIFKYSDKKAKQFEQACTTLITTLDNETYFNLRAGATSDETRVIKRCQFVADKRLAAVRSEQILDEERRERLRSMARRGLLDDPRLRYKILSSANHWSQYDY